LIYTDRSPIFFFLLLSYMYNPSDDQEPSLVSSLETCEPHQVRWEASVAGKVVLAPSGGSLPVENVIVSWKFFDADGEVVLEDSSSTDDGGNFYIVINELLDFTNAMQYPIQLSFLKITESGEASIKHRLLCDQETVDCSQNEGTATLYLKHLDFDVPFVAIDDTSVPFSGKVVVGGTVAKDIGLDDGCPIQGAEVCLKNRKAKGVEVETVCVTTDSFGEYSMPAVIGTTVSPVVRYMNHTFEPVNPDLGNKYEDGIYISPDFVYKKNDLKDVTTVDMFVDVFGGLCEKLLGVTTLLFNVLGCDWTREETQVRNPWEHDAFRPPPLLTLSTFIGQFSCRGVSAAFTESQQPFYRSK
jgi:hypothetical protein